MRRTLTRLLALASLVAVAACDVMQVAPRAETANDAAVYSAMLGLMYPTGLPDTLDVMDSSGGYWVRPEDEARLRRAGSAVVDSVPADLALRLARASAVRTAARTQALPRPARLVTDAEFGRIFDFDAANGGALADTASDRRRYLTLSPVVYDEDGTSALLFIQIQFPSGCGSGNLVWFVREPGGAWRLQSARTLYVS